MDRVMRRASWSEPRLRDCAVGENLPVADTTPSGLVFAGSRPSADIRAVFTSGTSKVCRCSRRLGREGTGDGVLLIGGGVAEVCEKAGGEDARCADLVTGGLSRPCSDVTTRVAWEGDNSLTTGRMPPSVDGVGPDTTRPVVTESVSPLPFEEITFGLPSGDLGGPAGFPLSALVKYPSSAAPGRGAGSLTTSPAFFSVSNPLPLLVRVLMATLFALGARSEPAVPLGTPSTLLPIPSPTLPSGIPKGVRGQPPGIPSIAGVGGSHDSFRSPSLDIRFPIPFAIAFLLLYELGADLETLPAAAGVLLLWLYRSSSASTPGMSVVWTR